MKMTLGNLKAKIQLFYFISIFFPLWAVAQRPTLQGKDSIIPIGPVNTTTKIDTLGKDSLQVNIVKNINISKDALDEPIDYEAKDSIIFDNKSNLVHLYRDASVKFQTIEVKAGYIVLNIKDNLAIAEPLKEKNGRTVGRPDFKDGEQNFKANKMRYNFKTRKGIVYDVQTLQQSLYVIGEKTKFVSANKADSSANDVIYSQDAILTTCSDPHPHYGIRAQKLKVITNKLVIVGPSNLEIGGVPTPIWLPLGFYPITKNKQTGLLFPTAYGFQKDQGLGLQGIGWYFPLGAHHDLQVRANYYTRGNWGIQTTSNYRYRYRFSGSYGLTFNNIAVPAAFGRPETERGNNRAFSLNWSHNQDPAARPNQTFSANVNISTNASTVQRNVAYDYRTATQNTLTSGVSFSKQFPSKPYSFSTGFNHSQNTNTHIMDMSYSANFPTQAMFPFRTAQSTSLPEGVNKFLDQFSINYNAKAEARLSTLDSLLLKKQTLDKIRTGITHSANTSAPVTLFKYITVSPNASFNQTLFFDNIKKIYHDTIFSRIKDTLTKERIPYQRGKIDTVRQTSLTPVNEFNTGLSFNTTLFGTAQFKKGIIRGFRHKIDISGGFNYRPVLTKESWFDSVRTPTALPRTNNLPPTYQRYSIFEGSLYSVSDPGRFSRASKSLNLTLRNTLEAKIKTKRDTIARKIRLLDNFTIPLSYDFSRDSLKFSERIPMSLTNSFVKGLIRVQLDWSVTPYMRAKNKYGTWQHTNNYLWKNQSLGKIGKLNIPKPFEYSEGRMNVSTGFTIRQMLEFFTKKDTATQKVEIKPTTQQKPSEQQPITKELPSITSLIDNFSVSYNYSIEFNKNTFSGRDTLYTSAHQIGINGSIPLSKKWNLNIGNIGLDFSNRGQLPYIDIGISRDLHCWELAGSWQPTRSSFFFTIRVKNAPLDFLKIPVQKGNNNAFGGFQPKRF